MARRPRVSPTKPKSVSPFDYVTALNNGTAEAFWQATGGEGYNAYMVMLSLSMHPDTVIAADQLNTLTRLTPAQHYTFLINTVRARKRPHRWAKTRKVEGLSAIAQHYHCSLQKARQYRPLLSDELVAVLIEHYGDK